MNFSTWRPIGEVEKKSLNAWFQPTKPIWTIFFLWHDFLEYPSFPLLKKLFPSLFEKIDVSNFHCESCNLAKHHCKSFPIK